MQVANLSREQKDCLLKFYGVTAATVPPTDSERVALLLEKLPPSPLVAGSGGAAAAAGGLPGRPDIVHCVRGGPSRPPAGCGNVQDSDDDEARGQRGDRWGAAAAAAVKPFCMHDRGKFDSQSKIQSGSARASSSQQAGAGSSQPPILAS